VGAKSPEDGVFGLAIAGVLVVVCEGVFGRKDGVFGRIDGVFGRAEGVFTGV